jgi:hypothetical protein
MSGLVRRFDEKYLSTTTDFLCDMIYFLSHGICRYQEMRKCGKYGLIRKSRRRSLFLMPMINLWTASDAFSLLGHGVLIEPLPR